MCHVHRSFIVLALAACTSAPPEAHSLGDTTRRAESNDTVVSDMLLAQLDGPGGCATVDHLDTLRSAFFPEVELFAAECSPEHGGTAEAVAGRDRNGVTFLLGSEAGFGFLLRRHPPSISPVSQPIEYVSVALRLSGALRPGTRIVRDTTDLSMADRARVRRAGVQASSRVLERRPNGVVVAVLTTSRSRIESLAVTVSSTGRLFTLQREELPSR